MLVIQKESSFFLSNFNRKMERKVGSATFGLSDIFQTTFTPMQPRVKIGSVEIMNEILRC